MADRIEITIAAEDETGGAFASARGNVDGLGGDLADVGEQLQTLSSETPAAGDAAAGAALDFGELGGAIGLLGAVGIPVTVAGLAELASQLNEMGSQAIRASNSLDVMTNGSAVGWTSMMQTATHGLIDDTDAATVATQLLTTGMADSADQAAHFVEVATVLGGAIKGLDAKTASEELANMFASGNVRAAKDFGLSVIELRDRINELKQADSGLTDQQIIQMAFMEQADPLAKQLSGTLDDQASAADKLKVAWADLGETLGEKVAPQMAPLEDMAAHALTVITDLAKGESVATIDANAHAAATQKLIGLTDAQAAALGVQNKEMTDANILGGVKLTQDQANSVGVKEYTSNLASQQEQYKQLISDIEQYNQQMEQEAATQLRAEQSMASLTQIGGNQSKMFDFAIQQMGNMHLSAMQMEAAYNSLGLATGRVTQNSIALANNLAEINNGMAKGVITAPQYIKMLGEIAKGQDSAAISAEAHKDAVTNIANAQMAQGVPAAYAVMKAQQEANSTLQGTTDSASEMQAKLDKLSSSKTTIQMDKGQIDAANAAVGNVEAALNGLNGKTVNVTVNVDVTGPGANLLP